MILRKRNNFFHNSGLSDGLKWLFNLVLAQIIYLGSNRILTNVDPLSFAKVYDVKYFCNL